MHAMELTQTALDIAETFVEGGGDRGGGPTSAGNKRPRSPDDEGDQSRDARGGEPSMSTDEPRDGGAQQQPQSGRHEDDAASTDPMPMGQQEAQEDLTTLLGQDHRTSVPRRGATGLLTPPTSSVPSSQPASSPPLRSRHPAPAEASEEAMRPAALVEEQDSADANATNSRVAAPLSTISWADWWDLRHLLEKEHRALGPVGEYGRAKMLSASGAIFDEASFMDVVSTAETWLRDTRGASATEGSVQDAQDGISAGALARQGPRFGALVEVMQRMPHRKRQKLQAAEQDVTRSTWHRFAKMRTEVQRQAFLVTWPAWLAGRS